MTWFGTSGGTASTGYSWSDWIAYFYARTPSKSGNLLFIKARMNSFGGGEYCRFAIYLSSSRELVAQTDSLNGGTGAPDEWITFNIGPSSISADTDYIIAYWGDEHSQGFITQDVAGTKRFYYDGYRDYSASGSGNFSEYLDPLDSQYNYSQVTGKLPYFTVYYTGRPVDIENVSGCISTENFTAILSAKITNSSGNVRFYYESGSAGGGTDPSAWDNYVDYGSIVYSGQYITKQLENLQPGWTYSFRGYISSNSWFGGEDWFDTTDTFTTDPITIYREGRSLRIYYSCSAYPYYYIDCWCKRFDVSNYDVIIETFLSPEARNKLFQSVTPGALRELYNILGKPKYIDTTYSSGNTLRLEPIGNLTNLENEMIIAVKSISDSSIPGASKKFNIKIEGKRLDI